MCIISLPRLNSRILPSSRDWQSLSYRSTIEGSPPSEQIFTPISMEKKMFTFQKTNFLIFQSWAKKLLKMIPNTSELMFIYFNSIFMFFSSQFFKFLIFILKCFWGKPNMLLGMQFVRTGSDHMKPTGLCHIQYSPRSLCFGLMVIVQALVLLLEEAAVISRRSILMSWIFTVFLIAGAN